MNANWTDMGVLEKGNYTIEITGTVHLGGDNPALFTGPQGRKFGKKQWIGAVSFDIGGKSYNSRDNGRNIDGGRAIDVEVTDATKGRMKVNDIFYDDNSGSYTVRIIKHN